MITTIKCPKCYYSAHFTMINYNFFCPICGSAMDVTEFKSKSDHQKEFAAEYDLSGQYDEEDDTGPAPLF